VRPRPSSRRPNIAALLLLACSRSCHRQSCTSTASRAKFRHLVPAGLATAQTGPARRLRSARIRSGCRPRGWKDAANKSYGVRTGLRFLAGEITKALASAGERLSGLGTRPLMGRHLHVSARLRLLAMILDILPVRMSNGDETTVEWSRKKRCSLFRSCENPRYVGEFKPDATPSTTKYVESRQSPRNISVAVFERHEFGVHSPFQEISKSRNFYIAFAPLVYFCFLPLLASHFFWNQGANLLAYCVSTY